MPIIEAHILQGYDEGTRTRLSHALTDAMRMIIPAPPDSFMVVVHELERENYMRGGAMRRRDDALPDPREAARRFNAAMMSGDFETADTLVTDDCRFRLLGGVQVARPHELASFTGANWQEFSMEITGADICPGPSGPIVYEHSSINGVTSGGTTITDLRSVIRFEFRGLLICDFSIMSDLPHVHQREPDTA